MKLTRERVYEVINSERKYQNSLWDNHEKEGNNPSSWLLWMQDYLTEAIHIASRNTEAPNTEGRNKIMGAIRKVTALGVAAMEANGAPERVE